MRGEFQSFPAPLVGSPGESCVAEKTKRRRDKKSKSQRVKEIKRGRVKETKGQRVKEIKRKRGKDKNQENPLKSIAAAPLL